MDIPNRSISLRYEMINDITYTHSSQIFPFYKI